jgi:hypothetical protein
VTLAGGLLLRNWVAGRHSGFVAGFRIGKSLAFMIAGCVRPSHARLKR